MPQYAPHDIFGKPFGDCFDSSWEIAAHGNAKDTAKAKDQVTEGDKDIAAGRYEGIGDYGSAWKLM